LLFPEKTAMKNFNTILRQIWYAGPIPLLLNPFIPLLSCLSVLYRFAAVSKNRLYDKKIFKQKRLPCPVISVGNLTVGGTGKTPTVIMLAKFLKEKGYRPAVLSRGYGGKTRSPVNIVSDGVLILKESVDVGDEPVLIAKSAEGIPVLTGADRFLTGQAAIKKMNADILILDDAFQHRRIFRDIDIVLLNRERPFGNGFLLPRGPLREPRECLKRADLILWKDTCVNGHDPHDLKQDLGLSLPVFSGYLKPKSFIRGIVENPESLDFIRGKTVCAFSGIGSPEAFTETLSSLGGTLVRFLNYPDHYRYTSRDISDIREISSTTGADVIVTTEKDGIRLSEFPDFLKDIFLLRVEMEILPSQEEFEALLLERLK
jgi:tetraacyldisaccharide 4'-kinase